MTRPPAVVHVDLDGTREIFASLGKRYDPARDPLFESGMAALLTFLDAHDIKATLFVIASQLDNPVQRHWLEEAVSRGHEIASHGLSHQTLTECSDETLRAEVADSRQALEAALGVPVEGFRAPHYAQDDRLLPMLEQAGYRWDSSRFRPAPTKTTRQQSKIARLDLPRYHPAPFPFSASYALTLGRWYLRLGLERARRNGDAFVLLFHLTDFAEPLPEAHQRGWRTRLYTLSFRSAQAKQRACAHLVEDLRRSFDIVSNEVLLARQSAPRLALGIAATHETGAALVDGTGAVLAAVCEERLDRVKFSSRYPPARSIECVLGTADVEPDAITDVVIAGLPAGRLFKRMIDNQWRDTTEYHALNDYVPHLNKLPYRLFTWVRALGYRRVVKHLERTYGIRPQVHFVAHHLAHAASAYRTAPFDDVLVVTADGTGDFATLTIAEGRRGNLTLRQQIDYPHSLGQFYTACTQLLGFRQNRHEGKITGLAGFGRHNPELHARVRSTLRSSGPQFALDKRFYSEGIVRGLSLSGLRSGEDVGEVFAYRTYKPPLKTLLDGFSREDVAYAFQTILEEELAAIVGPHVQDTGLTRVCVAGGVFANVRANSALVRKLALEAIHVFPHMGDGGLSVGAALQHLHCLPGALTDVYWGPSFPEARLRAALQQSGLPFEKAPDPASAIAARLAAGQIVARFDGRMEFGPRALGNRSILASAADADVNRTLNARLGRTEFMPFAPAALAEHTEKMFVDCAPLAATLPFMTSIVACTEFMRRQCPAVVHVDGTARPQLVTPESNPGLHDILTGYHALTGVPAVINTSFNMHEEPIVCTPEDAIRAFQASGLDALAMGPFVATQVCDQSAEPQVNAAIPESVSAGR